MGSSQPPQQPAALLEGRRIYLGNLLYIVPPIEIEEMLKENGFPNYEKIHISVDPVNARNPGYCFVDFVERADADRALSSLNTRIRGRPVKVGPCEPKKQQRQSRWKSDNEPTFNRWGNWTGQRGAVGGDDKRGTEDSPYAEIDHFDRSYTNGKGKRVWLGGLGRMIDQRHNYEEIREIFTGFNPVAVGKHITAHESKRALPGNHNYCFIDFETVEEATSAIQAVNGMKWDGETLHAEFARPIPEKMRARPGPTREDDNSARKHTSRSGSPARDDGSSRESRERPDDSSWRTPWKERLGSSTAATGQPSRSFASSNWRQREPSS